MAKCSSILTFRHLGEMSRFTRFDACWQNVAIYALCQAQNFGCQALSTILHPQCGHWFVILSSIVFLYLQSKSVSHSRITRLAPSPSPPSPSLPSHHSPFPSPPPPPVSRGKVHSQAAGSHESLTYDFLAPMNKDLRLQIPNVTWFFNVLCSVNLFLNLLFT